MSDNSGNKNKQQSTKFRSCVCTALLVISATSFSFYYSNLKSISTINQGDTKNQIRVEPRIIKKTTGGDGERRQTSITTTTKKTSTRLGDEKGGKEGELSDDDNHVIEATSKKQITKKDKSTSSTSSNSHKTKKTNKKKNIKRIALLGERHSGTNWITDELEKCFPTLRVEPQLLRWKHWFQTNDNRTNHDQTLVIAQFRNVYDWTAAMRAVPHHSPNHLFLKWEDFVTKPWSMPRPRRDLEIEDKENVVCNWGFRYRELVSCLKGTRMDPEYVALKTQHPRKSLFSGHRPLYELNHDGSGRPYDSILHLRSAKIRNFLSVSDWDWVEGVIPVTYERLVADGTEFLLREIEETVGIQRECEAVPPREEKTGTKKKKSRGQLLGKEFIDYLSEHVDWETESLVGYEKWSDSNVEDDNISLGTTEQVGGVMKEE